MRFQYRRGESSHKGVKEKCLLNSYSYYSVKCCHIIYTYMHRRHLTRVCDKDKIRKSEIQEFLEEVVHEQELT